MKLLEYNIQLAMITTLLKKGLLTKQEFEKVKHKLMKDYGVISNIIT